VLIPTPAPNHTARPVTVRTQYRRILREICRDRASGRLAFNHSAQTAFPKWHMNICNHSALAGVGPNQKNGKQNTKTHPTISHTDGPTNSSSTHITAPAKAWPQATRPNSTWLMSLCSANIHFNKMAQFHKKTIGLTTSTWKIYLFCATAPEHTNLAGVDPCRRSSAAPSHPCRTPECYGYYGQRTCLPRHASAIM